MRNAIWTTMFFGRVFVCGLCLLAMAANVAVVKASEQTGEWVLVEVKTNDTEWTEKLAKQNDQWRGKRFWRVVASANEVMFTLATSVASMPATNDIGSVRWSTPPNVLKSGQELALQIDIAQMQSKGLQPSHSTSAWEAEAIIRTVRGDSELSNSYMHDKNGAKKFCLRWGATKKLSATVYGKIESGAEQYDRLEVVITAHSFLIFIKTTYLYEWHAAKVNIASTPKTPVEIPKPTPPATTPANTNPAATMDDKYALASDAYYNGRYAEAVPLLRELADLKHAKAQHNLGRCYYNGWSVNRDHAIARKWLRDALPELRRLAEQGDEEAQDRLGGYYQYGLGGVAKNPTEAIRLSQKAAERGWVNPNYNIGN